MSKRTTVFALIAACAVELTVSCSHALAQQAPDNSTATYDRLIEETKAQTAKALLRLRALTIDSSPPPANEIVSISCANGSVFQPRADGCFIASGPNPEHEVLTLTIKPTRAGNVLRLDFPLDDSLPGRGPGRTGNGNFAISEVEIEGMYSVAAWASASEAPCYAWQTVDAINDNADNCWNADAHRHDPRTLLLALTRAAPAGVPLKVRLICKSKWGEHVPGCISAAVLPVSSIAADVAAVGQAERDIVRFERLRLFALARSLGSSSSDGSPKRIQLKSGDKIVAIGDSITAAGGYLRSIDAVLAAQYPDLKIPTVINKGIGGQKAEDLLRRFDRDVIQLKPAFVTISIGINDVWHRLNRPHDENVLAAYKRNVASIIDAAQKAGIRVILLTPTLIQEDPNSEGNQRLAKYVAAEKEIAAEKKCQLVDLHGLFLAALKTQAEVRPRGWLTGDGVHMSPLGDTLMAAATLRALGVPNETLVADRKVPARGESSLVKNLKAGRAQTVITYGTSLTSGGAWVKQLDAALDARWPGLATVVNSGASGMWSKWGVENLDARVIAKKPDTLLIEFGINDAFHEYKTSVAEARANLSNMIDRVLVAKADTEIILMTMNPPIENHLRARPDIKRYYEMYRQVAKERGLQFIDHEPHWRRILEHNAPSFHELVRDGIHPGAAGCAKVITSTLLTSLGVPPVSAPGKIKVLLVGGRGSHDWTGFHETLAPVLEKAGDFELYITLELDTLMAAHISTYDLVLFYGPGGDFTDKAQEQGLHDFVTNGGGLAGVHATDAFKKSDVYWRLMGGRFITHRGGRFTIRIMDKKHPVTAPFEDFQIHDETYRNEYHPDFKLHSLFRMDRGEEQQSMGWVQNYGKGRVFNTTLGHDGKAWKSESFQKIVLRGLYWAAGREPK